MAKGLWAAVLISTLTAGCAQWPSYGRGGDAERYTGADAYLAAANVENTAAYLQSQVEVLQSQLDVLVLQGAMTCLPASVRRLGLISHRIRREIHGDLFADATHNLVIFQRELRFLRQQFIQVSLQTHCHQPVEKESSVVALFSIYFDVDDASIAPVFIDQLSWWQDQTSSQTEWLVRGYTDSDGSESHNDTLASARVEAVVSALKQQGISSEFITTDIQGERSLALFGPDDFSKGLNRRVDLFLSSQDAFKSTPVQQWDDLNLKDTRSLGFDWQ